jgi:hypothetical protein
MLNFPPPTELFSIHALAERHPALLSENRLRRAVRNCESNGLAAPGAVFDSPVGEFILHEPAVIGWVLGLSGRPKPRDAAEKTGVGVTLAAQTLPNREM